MMDNVAREKEMIKTEPWDILRKEDEDSAKEMERDSLCRWQRSSGGIMVV